MGVALLQVREGQVECECECDQIAWYTHCSVEESWLLLRRSCSENLMVKVSATGLERLSSETVDLFGLMVVAPLHYHEVLLWGGMWRCGMCGADAYREVITVLPEGSRDSPEVEQTADEEHAFSSITVPPALNSHQDAEGPLISSNWTFKRILN